MISEQTLELIKLVNSGEAGLTVQKTDDNVYVFNQATYDTKSGARVADTVADAVKRKALKDSVEELQASIDSINNFLEAQGETLPEEAKRPDIKNIRRSFIEVFGPDLGPDVWKFLSALQG